jgi:hypothetical protein
VKSLVLAIIGSLALSGLAAAADSEGPARSNPTNPFALGPDFPKLQRPLITPGDDEASPFVVAHSSEQALYDMHYLIHYRISIPSWAKTSSGLSPSVDAQGRPLWFDHGAGEGFLESIVTQLLQNEQFLDVERVFDDWSDPSKRQATGRPMLAAYSFALQTNLINTPDWDATYQKIKRWRTMSPYAPAAAIAEAEYWQWYAWNARGAGYASTVTPDGWKLFHERLQKAEAVLDESRSFASDSPLWGLAYIEVGTGLGWPKDRILRQLAESAAKDPTFSLLYTTTAYYLTPRWGGDWLLVDQLARSAVKSTEATEGWSYYALVYMSVDSCCGTMNLFRDTDVSWPDMKRGFEDLVRLYPHSAWNVNRFAAYACVAGDKDAYVRMRLKLGKQVMPAAWLANYSFDLCEHKFPPTAL